MKEQAGKPGFGKIQAFSAKGGGDSRFLSRQKKSIFVQQIGDQFVEKAITAVSWHPSNAYILSFVDNHQNHLKIFNLQKSMKIPIYSIKTCPVRKTTQT